MTNETTPNENAQPPATRNHRHGAVLVLFVLAMGVLYMMVERGGGAPEGWLTDLDQAKRQAAAANRLLFVEFGADWCAACTQMKRTVFSQDRVRSALAEFVAVHVDVDAQKAIAIQHGVSMLPTFVVMDHKGGVLAKFEGAMPAEQLLGFLDAHRRVRVRQP